MSALLTRSFPLKNLLRLWLHVVHRLLICRNCGLRRLTVSNFLQDMTRCELVELRAGSLFEDLTRFFLVEVGLCTSCT
jgi:hypothetical protein